MKRLLLLVLVLLTLTGTARAWSWWNYPPDNEYVEMESTNLPIVWIDVDGQYIDRYEAWRASMVMHQ